MDDDSLNTRANLVADPTALQPGGPAKSATEVLAELVARRKAAVHPAAKALHPDRQAERAAAARSASKSKPAMKKT